MTSKILGLLKPFTVPRKIAIGRRFFSGSQLRHKFGGNGDHVAGRLMIILVGR